MPFLDRNIRYWPSVCIKCTSCCGSSSLHMGSSFRKLTISLKKIKNKNIYQLINVRINTRIANWMESGTNVLCLYWRRIEAVNMSFGFASTVSFSFLFLSLKRAAVLRNPASSTAPRHHALTCWTQQHMDSGTWTVWNCVKLWGRKSLADKALYITLGSFL